MFTVRCRFSQMKNGWNGITKIDRQNGLSYLVELGYESALSLIPSKS